VSHNSQKLLSNKFLSKDGIYVIEDIQPENIEKFLDLSIFPTDCVTYINDNFIIKYYDTRKDDGRADDFMMCFIKNNS